MKRVTIAAVILACAAPIIAAQRTFVSAVAGNDMNLCGRTAPCRNFAAALALTDADGEVVVLDSGGYGTVTIAQSVSLIAPRGVFAGITSLLGNAVTVDAGDSGRVALRNLVINSQSSLANGVDADTVG